MFNAFAAFSISKKLIERALFLKEKLDNLPENKGHLFDNTGKTIEQELAELQIEKFIV